MAIIIGDAGNNSLPGTAEADQIRGLDGNDRLEGRAGHDTLDGGRGRDTIYGGTGRDVLIGGLGRDILLGGSGPDTFRFDDNDTGDASVGSLADVIRDFGQDDIVDLVAVDVVGVSGGVQPERGMFSWWESEGDTYITWNTFGAYHDVVLTGVTGLSLSQIRWYEDDYLANRFTTGRVAPGGTVNGTIEKTQDADWFRITLDESQLYTFELKGEPSGSGTLDDPHVAVFDSSGNLLAENYDDGTLDARLRWNPDSNSVYYVSADGSGNTTGTYKLHVSSVPYSDDFPDNTSTAGIVDLGQPQAGEIELNNDVDWIRAELEQGVEYSLEVKGRSSGSGTLRDPYVLVHDENGFFADWDDNGGAGRDAEVLFTPWYTGTWYIAALANDGGTGTYEVSVSLV